MNTPETRDAYVSGFLNRYARVRHIAPADDDFTLCNRELTGTFDLTKGEGDWGTCSMCMDAYKRKFIVTEYPEDVGALYVVSSPSLTRLHLYLVHDPNALDRRGKPLYPKQAEWEAVQQRAVCGASIYPQGHVYAFRRADSADDDQRATCIPCLASPIAGEHGTEEARIRMWTRGRYDRSHLR